MRVVTGPAGSGKTATVLGQVRKALQEGRDDIRLLVPTATMTEHLQNGFAREGLVFRRSIVQTLSGFVETRTPEIRQVSAPVLYLIVEQMARRAGRPEFARVVDLPGFCATLAQSIEDFSSAGCNSERLAACLPDAPLAEAFLAVYRYVDRELERRRVVLRGRRLEIAAERIEREGLGGITVIWLDGFHALPDPELRVIAALTRHADVTLAIGVDDLDGRVRALATNIERRVKSRPSPAVSIVRAPGIERECEEIARRILQQSAAGRPFREIGIVVRSADAYAPILGSTLERFGIPARFYMDAKLERSAEVRFVTGVVDAMLGGWDHERTLAAMRLATGLEDSVELDRFDFEVRKQIPNAGLEALRELGAPSAVAARLEATEEWRGLRLAAADWAARMSAWAKTPLIAEALDEAAEALDGTAEMPIGEYWRAVKAVLRLKPLRAVDRRRNVVNVLSAHEARQWVLPVIFVCGLVEKQFPQFHRQDPFFPDAARRALHANGVRVRTAEQFEREERALFEAAVTRGTMSVTLTLPEFDARGDRNLPSLFLERFALPVERARAVRMVREDRMAGRRRDAIPAGEYLRERTAKVSATALESFLQCPFQYFGGRLLRLTGAPERPEKRLNFLTQGGIVHEVLATWWKNGGNIEPIFQQVFARHAKEEHIPISYQTERARNAMLDDLRKFADDDSWPRADYESETEREFEFALNESVAIRGKIDRLDIGRDGRATVIDYKYSNAQRTKAKLGNENLLQAPLYLMAAERAFGLTPGAMYYVGIKGGVEYAEWAPAGDWAQRTADRTLRVVEEIRAGRVDVSPADVENCRFCDVRDICRVETRKAAALAERA